MLRCWSGADALHTLKRLDMDIVSDPIQLVVASQCALSYDWEQSPPGKLVSDKNVMQNIIGIKQSFRPDWIAFGETVHCFDSFACALKVQGEVVMATC
jgi:hypothetical protein